MRKELERVKPGDVDMSAAVINEYIDKLEMSGSEMHGIMITRYNKVCTEGWWKPYSPLLRHGLQSLTKSYVTTAVGMLIGEKMLRLDEKLIDILPEYMPENPSDNLKFLIVHDMLCMGSGLESMQDRTKTSWVKDFFASPFVNRPGTKFYYSGVVTSILGVVLKKRTGLTLTKYLTPRLFDRIGIDVDNLKWIEHPDGMEYGGGGMFATTEDNLRLGLLYLNKGKCEDERLLSEEWVNTATSKQIDNSLEPAADNKVGYGYQMWMCRPEGVYRFDGAHGQFVIVVPNLDMVISINQYAEKKLPQKILDITWEFLNKIEGAGGDEEALNHRLTTLCLPRVESTAIPDSVKKIDNNEFDLEENEIKLIPSVYRMLSHKVPAGMKSIGFRKESGFMMVSVDYGGRIHEISVSTDGIDRLSYVYIAHDLPDMVYASGFWTKQGNFIIHINFIETCYIVDITVIPEDKGITLKTFAIGTLPEPDSGKEIFIKSKRK